MRIGDNNSLPSGWGWFKAKDIIDVRDGTHDSPKYQASGIPLVTSKNLVDGKIDISNCSFISEIDHASISKRSAVGDGDILYAMIGTIGNPVVVKKDFEFSIKNVALFKFENSNVFNRYIYHFLKTDLVQIQFRKNARGGTQKFISLGNIRDLLIPLPPLKEQKRIAAILDKADAIRRKRQQAIDLTDQLLRSVFLDMFGDPVANNYDWGRVSLESLCRKITDGTHHSPEPKSEGVPYITAKHLKPNRLDFCSKPTYVSTEAHKGIYSRCNPEINDVLYIKDGATTGVAAINPYDFEFSMLSSLALIKVDTVKLLPEYLCDWLNYESVKERILKNMSGAAISRLTIRKIKDLIIELPPIGKQQRYRDIRSGIMESRMKLNSSVEEAEKLFCLFLKKLFGAG